MDKIEIIKSNVKSIVASLLYYDRKEDEDLPRGEIERMISAGEVTEAQIVEWFADALSDGLGTNTERG